MQNFMWQICINRRLQPNNIFLRGSWRVSHLLVANISTAIFTGLIHSPKNRHYSFVSSLISLRYQQIFSLELFILAGWVNWSATARPHSGSTSSFNCATSKSLLSNNHTIGDKIFHVQFSWRRTQLGFRVSFLLWIFATVVPRVANLFSEVHFPKKE